MANRDPIESALDALVAYLADALEDAVGEADLTYSVTVRKGWPERDTDLALESGPILTVSQVGTPTEEPCSPTSVDVDGSTVTFRVGYLLIRVQLDLWSEHRAQREDVGLLVQQCLHNQMPVTSGLWIDSTNYYGRPLSIEARGGKLFDENSEPAAVGEWRRTWDLAVETDLILERTIAPQTQIDIVATVDDGDPETTTIESE